MIAIARLAIDQSADRLELSAPPARTWWGLKPGLATLRRVRPPVASRVGAAQRIVCDPDGLTIEHKLFDREPRRCQRIARAELHGLRLIAVGRERGGLVVELRAATTNGQPVTPVRFRAAGLDVNDEVIELGLQMARALGLERFRVLEVEPPDIELLGPTEDSASPYRAGDHTRAVPARNQPFDFAAARVDTFVEPGRDIPTFDQARAPRLGWKVDQWEPGTRIRTRRQGWSRTAAAIPFALFYLPLSAVGMFFAVFVGGSAVGAAPIFVLMVFAFILAGLGIDGTSFLALGTAASLFIGFLMAAVWAGKGLYSWCRDGYRDRLEHACEFDWTAHDLALSVGRVETERIPLEDITGVAVRRGAMFAHVGVRVGPRDIDVARWRGHRCRDAADEAGVALARALGVPVSL